MVALGVFTRRGRKRVRAWIGLLLIACAPVEMRGNATLESFNTAKIHVYVLSQANPRTFYCGCSFLDKRVMAQTCGYVPAKPGKRSERVEVEHIVPAAVMGAHLPEWQKGL